MSKHRYCLRLAAPYMNCLANYNRQVPRPLHNFKYPFLIIFTVNAPIAVRERSFRQSCKILIVSRSQIRKRDFIELEDLKRKILPGVKLWNRRFT
jgi:hypothetical protein